ncbi:MAG TPA: hypothetical protein VMV09_09575 [Candidatus Saccharimonadales bacterium]|nr:hypothetical protein [Candidatus Saccharimonadales bacterium]
MARALVAGTLVVVGLTLTALVLPAEAAGSWWVRSPPSAGSISALATNQGPTTLAISEGVPGWYRPSTGHFAEIPGMGTGHPPGLAVAVAAEDGRGVVAFSGGSLIEVTEVGTWHLIPSVPGVPKAVAVIGGQPLLLAVATSGGLYSGLVGDRLSLVTPGAARLVLAPTRPGLAWQALVAGELWTRPTGRAWGPAPGAPLFDGRTHVMAELSDGSILVAEPGGLVWRGVGRRWFRAFQLLPYGGLGGVPQPTSLAADGEGSAYLATDGFGTLLTPDGGYSWYRAAPPEGAISSLATVGPVFGSKARGYVVATSAAGLFLHRLQLLPEPPVYSPFGQTAELLGTAAVTVVAALLTLLALWYLSRLNRSLSV